MANQTLNLPAPARNGAGDWVDVSSFGGLKTISVEGNGGVYEPFVTVEFSNEAAPSSGTPVCPTFQVPGEETVTVAARFMRAVVSNYRGGGAPSVDIGGTDDGTDFATLVAPAGNGAGAPVDTSALPAFKTIQIAGPFRGTVIVEISEDGGNRWATLAAFTHPGAQSFVLIAEFMRVRRGGVPQVSPGLPVVNVGAVSAGGGGGGVIPDPLIVDNLTVNEVATIEEATIQFATIQQLLDVRLADNTPIFRVEADGITANVNMSLDGDLTVFGENVIMPGLTATPDQAAVNGTSVYLAAQGGGTDPMDGNVVVDLLASKGMVVQDQNGNRVFRAYGGASFGDMAISFFNADLAPPQSITGATTQAQVDAIVALLVTFGLGIDNR